MISSNDDPSFSQTIWAIKCSTRFIYEQNLWEVDHLLPISEAFLCVFVNGGVVIDFPTFFRRWHWVILNTVVSPVHMKSYPMVRLAQFIVSRLICCKEYKETTIKWSLLAPSCTFVGAANVFFLKWYLTIILNISNVDLPFAGLDVKTDFSEAVKSYEQPMIAQ